jgi:sugar lactone lactonase YvrE
MIRQGALTRSYLTDTALAVITRGILPGFGRLRALAVGLLALPAALLSSSEARAFSPTNGQAAASVIGQPNLTAGGTGTGLNQLNSPSDVAVDPTTGKIFVADQNNHRVLRYASAALLTSGATAEAVFGSLSAGCSASQFWQPYAVYVDGVGRLWVADMRNNRVLRFDSASTAASGASASGVLGQPSFVTCTSGAPTASSLSFPQGITGNSAGVVWVSDTYNSRILRFDNAAALPNGSNANAVIGQPNFVSNATGSSQTSLYYPQHLHVDVADHLWVPDTQNSRVLRFDGASSLGNGPLATMVLGQIDFVSSVGSVSATGMLRPTGVTTDASGRLLVSDYGNARVLSFNGAATLANGAPATAVLGQTDFVTATAGLSATQLNFPMAVLAVPSPDVLLVVDYGNSRVLRFGATATAAPAPVPAASRSMTLAFAALLMVAGALHVRRRRALTS